jgi:methionyl aminopeptidase
MHEDPEMPNYGKRGSVLVEGMVVAIEPMINMGTKTSNNTKTDDHYCRWKTICPL